MKLSIIIPCYNVAAYLDRSLLCLVNQTIDDFEIICIDDASTDNTLDSLRNWAKRDLRIRVIENKKNKGVGPTRNRGIDMALGEYVGFLDPDDYVDLNFFERLILVADKNKSQCVCGQLCVVESNGKQHRDPYRSVQEMRRTHHNFKYHYTAIYRRDFLNNYNIRYPALSINEDSVFETMVKCILTRPFILVPGVFYYYCRRDDSLNSDYWPESKIRESINGIGTIIDIYNSMPVSDSDYICGAHGYFNYLSDVTLGKNIKTQILVVTAMCDLFKRLKFTNKYSTGNYPLYLALVHNDPEGVLGVLNAQKLRKRSFMFMGCFKFMTISYNTVQKDIFLFGLLIARIKIT